MPALPRATCPTCNADVALRKGGEFREHNVDIVDAPPLVAEEFAGKKCPNSGQMAVAPAEAPEAGHLEQPDADLPAEAGPSLVLSLDAQTIADRRPGGAWSDAEAVVLTVDQVDPDPDNPRGPLDLDDPALHELASSIAIRGVLEPIIVTPHGDRYRLVAGHRRLAAARIAGVPVPALVRKDYADAPDLAKVDQVIENLQRSDLTPLQEAKAFDALRKAGMTQTDIALAVGVNQGTVSKRLALLKLPKDVQAQVTDGTIDVAAAVELARLPKDVAGIAAKSIAGGTRPDAAITNATNEVARTTALEAAIDEANAAGLAVVDYPQHGHWDTREDLPLITAGMARRLGVQYSPRGYVDVLPDTHATEPCHGVAIGWTYNGLTIVPVCLDPNRHGPTTVDKQRGELDARNEEFEARRETDRIAKEQTLAARWAATQTVVAAKLTRPTMVDTVALWTVQALIADQYQSTAVDREALELTLDLLGIDVAPGDDPDEGDARTNDLLAAVAKADGSLRVAFVGCLAAAEDMLRSGWRVPNSHPLIVNHFALLAEHGAYDLTEDDITLITIDTPPPTPDELLAAAGTPPVDAVAYYVASPDEDGADESRWVFDHFEAETMATFAGDRLIWVDGPVATGNHDAQPAPVADDDVSLAADDDVSLAAEADAAHDAAEAPEIVPGEKCPGSGSPTPAGVASYAVTACPKCGLDVESSKSGKRAAHAVPVAADV